MATSSNVNALIGPTRFGAPTGTDNLGGPYQGYSAQQTRKGHNNFGDIATRTILRNSWNTPYAVGTIQGTNQKYSRVITPFRAVNNSGDFLARINYSCGGSNQVNIDKPGMRGIIGSVPQQCDGTGIPASSCNPRFVADSSITPRSSVSRRPTTTTTISVRQATKVTALMSLFSVSEDVNRHKYISLYQTIRRHIYPSYIIKNNHVVHASHSQ